MRLNYAAKTRSTIGRWIATTVFCVAAIAFVWQGAFFSNTAALADSTGTLIAADLGDQIKGAADKLREGSKDLIRGTEGTVKKAANDNAAKVDEADDTGSGVERKAKRDKSRIEKRASEDANRTSEQVDRSMNAVKGAVDKTKDALSK